MFVVFIKHIMDVPTIPHNWNITEGANTMDEPENKTPTIKAHCNICLGEKNHQVLFKHKRHWFEDVAPDFSVDGDDVYELLQCGGCDSIKLRHKSRFSEDFDENGPVTTTHYYPPVNRH